MPAPARKTPAKKPAKKATAAVRARREVRAEKAMPVLSVAFRGEKFDIPLDRLGAFYMRGQYMAEFGYSDEQLSKMLFRLLGKVDSARFLDLIHEGDGFLTVSGEFAQALNKAANVPNS